MFVAAKKHHCYGVVCVCAVLCVCVCVCVCVCFWGGGLRGRRFERTEENEKGFSSIHA